MRRFYSLRSLLLLAPIAMVLVGCRSQKPLEATDTAVSLAKLEAGAKKGDRDAQYDLGQRYALGDGVA